MSGVPWSALYVVAGLVTALWLWPFAQAQQARRRVEEAEAAGVVVAASLREVRREQRRGFGPHVFIVGLLWPLFVLAAVIGAIRSRRRRCGPGRVSGKVSDVDDQDQVPVQVDTLRRWKLTAEREGSPTVAAAIRAVLGVKPRATSEAQVRVIDELLIEVRHPEFGTATMTLPQPGPHSRSDLILVQHDEPSPGRSLLVSLHSVPVGTASYDELGLARRGDALARIDLPPWCREVTDEMIVLLGDFDTSPDPEGAEAAALAPESKTAEEAK